MNDRWHWDFEDEQASSSTARGPALGASSPSDAAPVEPDAVTVPPADGKSAPPARRRAMRMVSGVVVTAAIVVALVAALAGGHGGRPATAPGDRAGLASAHLAHAPARAAQAREPTRKAVASVLAYTPFVMEGGTQGRDVALTFDDGPGPYTPGVLSVLERMHVHATFFVIGKMLRYFSASAVREIRDGDVIGDHTETHPQMARLSAHEQFEQLFEQIVRIELLGGPRPVLFRPPYGSYNATTMRELHRLHLLMTLWSVDTGDYLQPGVGTILRRVLAGAHPGAIVLMHDAGGTRTQTIATLPHIIAALRARGYRLVTVPQLLHDDPPPPGQPLPINLSGD